MTKYQEIFDVLKRDILNGKYASGSYFPSERALMRRFSASRDSIRHALDQLKERKFVSSCPRSSTKVVFGRRRRLGLIPSMANSEFFVSLAARISRVCQDSGYSLLFALAESTPLEDPRGYALRVAKIADEFLEQGVKGVLYQPVAFWEGAEEINARNLAAFDAAGIPVVLIDYDLAPVPERSKYDVVGIDNLAAGLRIAEHLADNGAQRIHFFKRSLCSAAVLNRMHGVALGATLRGLEWGERCVLTCEMDDVAAISRHFRSRPLPDAVVCGYDSLAFSLEKHLGRIGIPVPERVMLAGFDDRNVASTLQLTTIHQPIEQIAEAAVARLLQRIENPRLLPSEIFIDAPLVVRASTRPADDVKVKPQTGKSMHKVKPDRKSTKSGKSRLASACRKALGIAAAALCFMQASADGMPATERRLTPVMGWSSWNSFGHNISREKIRSQMDALCDLGLKDAGWEYVNVDDCFQDGRDAETGRLRIDLAKFPGGYGDMRALSDYAHSKGLKFGIYSDGGDNSCASMQKEPFGLGVGLYGHERDDLNMYLGDGMWKDAWATAHPDDPGVMGWNCDFIKIDWCGGAHLGLSDEDQYNLIMDEIELVEKRTGKDKIVNVCRWAYAGPWQFRADSWRSGPDIDGRGNSWESVMVQVDIMKGLWQYTRPGSMNDADMLVAGLHLSDEEDQSHFAMWCMFSSPLLIGQDLRTIRPETLALYKNSELIAINQDPAVLCAAFVGEAAPGVEIWVKPLGDERSPRRALALLNRNSDEVRVEFDYARIGYTGPARGRDVIAHADIAPACARAVSLPPHGVDVLVLEPAGRERVLSYLGGAGRRASAGAPEANLRVDWPNAERLVSQGGVLVDVRTCEEFGAGHADGAVNIPVSDLFDKVRQAIPDTNKVVVCYCRTAKRSAQSAGILRTLGYENAKFVGDGFSRYGERPLARESDVRRYVGELHDGDWTLPYPVARGKPDISWEGGQIDICGKKYERGVGVEALSNGGGSLVVCDIPPDAGHFVAVVGRDRSAGSDKGKTARFSVRFDGKDVASSPEIGWNDEWLFCVPVPRGAKRAMLVTAGAEGRNYCAWGNAGFTVRKIRLSRIFSDHMVVQRDKPLTVWGFGSPGEGIEVSFAGKSATCVAGEDGSWQAVLPPPALSVEPREISAKGNGGAVFVRDVLVGDVWLITGQSNAEMTFGQGILNGDAEMATSKDYPQIRAAKFEKKKSASPEADSCNAPWTICTRDTLPGLSALGWFFAREIVRETGIPIGILDNNWGGCCIEPYISKEGFASVPALKTYYDQIPGNAHLCGQYNAMIAPISRLSICGIAWYQGCSNSPEGERYIDKLHALVNSWRPIWGEDVPFYIVQLSTWKDKTSDPEGGDGFAPIRNAQRIAAGQIPRSGLVVTIDIGADNNWDIHPKNKLDVGLRLARFALRDVYGKSGLVASGPLFAGLRSEGDGRIRVLFEECGSGLMAGEKAPHSPGVAPVPAKDGVLKGFAVAGEDRKWAWAEASIDGNSVVLSSPEVSNPVAVRYAYRMNPQGACNLYNKEGLPASPFRTDNW